MNALDHVAEAESGDDQRRVGLDVRAHDEDVAGLECLVVGEEAEQNLAQDVDLAGRTVATVHLHRPVIGLEPSAFSAHDVGGDVGLQPAEQRVRTVVPAEIFIAVRIRGQAALELAKIAAEGGQQRMTDLTVTGVVAAGDLAVRAGERLPQRVAGVRQPQVEVVVGRQRVEQFDLGPGQPRVAEEGDPLGQVGGGLLKRGKGFSVADVGRVGIDAVQQRAPQGRLPIQVRVDITGDVVLPVDESCGRCRA